MVTVNTTLKEIKQLLETIHTLADLRVKLFKKYELDCEVVLWAEGYQIFVRDKKEKLVSSKNFTIVKRIIFEYIVAMIIECIEEYNEKDIPNLNYKYGYFITKWVKRRYRAIKKFSEYLDYLFEKNNEFRNYNNYSYEIKLNIVDGDFERESTAVYTSALSKLDIICLEKYFSKNLYKLSWENDEMDRMKAFNIIN